MKTNINNGHHPVNSGEVTPKNGVDQVEENQKNSTARLAEIRKREELLEGLISLQKTILDAGSKEAKDNAKSKLDGYKKEQDELEQEKEAHEEYLRNHPPADPEPWRNVMYVCDGVYYMANDREDPSKGFFKIQSPELVTTELQMMGLSSKPSYGGETSQVSRAKRAISRQQSVIWAGTLAGHTAGLKNFGNNKAILVTTTTNVLQPEKGDCEYSKAFLEGLFGQNVKYAYAWLKAHYTALSQSVEGKPQRPVPAWVISGETGCGKTLLAESTLMEIVGGGPKSSVNPIKYATGITSFNIELAASVYHLIDDDMTDTSYKQRKAVGNDLKKGSATTTVRIEEKHENPINVEVSNRKVVLVNDEMESLQVLPPINVTLKDKILILRCEKFTFPQFPPKWDGIEGTEGEWHARREVLVEESPALMWWILNEWETPAELTTPDKEGRKPRFGFWVIQDERVITAMCEEDPEETLKEILEGSFARAGDSKLKEGYWDEWDTASGLYEHWTAGEMLMVGLQNLVRKSSKSLGIYLSRLASKYPKSFQKQEKSHNNSAKYRIWRGPAA
jgi:hypothetical protein